MSGIYQLLKKLQRNDKGATVIEYALIASLVAIVAIAGFTLVGTQVSTKMSAVGSGLS